MLNLEDLADRREALCLRFGKKAYACEKFTKWFCESDNTVFQLSEVNTRTVRYWKSP